MEWLEEHNYDSKQLKEGHKYTIGFITIAFIFGCLSYLVLRYSSGAKFTDFYAAFSGIIGGLVGGLITLEGVRRTVYAQIKVESLKLIPNKVVHLHKLKREIKSLEAIREEFEAHRSDLNHYTDLDFTASSEDMAWHLIKLVDPYKEVMTLASKSFEDKEEELIKIVAEIDLKMYYKITQLFKELNTELKVLESSVESANILIHFPDEGLGVMKSAITVYDESISSNNGVLRGNETFVNTMKRGKIMFRGDIISENPSATVAKQILKVAPHLQTIVNSLDKRIKELKDMRKQRLDGYEKLDKTML